MVTCTKKIDFERLKYLSTKQKWKKWDTNSYQILTNFDVDKAMHRSEFEIRKNFGDKTECQVMLNCVYEWFFDILFVLAGSKKYYVTATIPHQLMLMRKCLSILCVILCNPCKKCTGISIVFSLCACICLRWIGSNHLELAFLDSLFYIGFFLVLVIMMIIIQYL